MKILYIVCIAVLAVIIAISAVYKREATTFYGIAETKEVVINSEYAVELEALHVVEGQHIKKGEPLADLDRPDLRMKINDIHRKLGLLRAERSTNAKQSRARISKLKAQIDQLEAEYKLNKQLTSELKSLKQGTQQDGDTANPVLTNISNLKKELAFEQALSGQGKKESSAGSRTSPVKMQISNLERELKQLEADRAALAIRAPLDGVIGSVSFKQGQKVSPFTPIITLHTNAPSYVKGYIHEKAYNSVRMGQQLKLQSAADRHNRCIGRVAGVGSRIVSYPLRLRKHPDIQIWGREIVIKLPPDNRFLLGEKVLISSNGN